MQNMQKARYRQWVKSIFILIKIYFKWKFKISFKSGSSIIN